VSERERLERAARRLVEIATRDFGVPPPKVSVVTEEEAKAACGGHHACYRYWDKEIVLSGEAAKSTRMVLHELAHHLQHYRAGWDAGKAFPTEEYSKPWHERGHEREAEALARAFVNFYFDTHWELLRGGEPREVGGDLVCGYAARRAATALHYAERSVIDAERHRERGDREWEERARRVAREDLEEAGAVGEFLRMVCPSVREKFREQMVQSVRRALEALEEGDYATAGGETVGASVSLACALERG
jgi:hypothetical protein